MNLPIKAQSDAVSGTKRQMLDGVAAVVGNETILRSDILQQIYILAQQKQNSKIDVNDKNLYQQVLNSVIDEKLVLAQAKEDSIVVNEDEVQQALDMRLSGLIQQVGSEQRLEKIYGMTMSQIKDEAKKLIQSQMLIEMMQRRKFGSIKPTEKDVQEFYNIYKDSLPNMPDQYELRQIALKIKPNAKAKEATFALAKSIIDSLKNGADFSVFAKKYSADPGSAERGGDLGFVQEGRFVKSYEDATKKLNIMEISEPVESQFGFHIIQLLDRKNNENHTRHILLKVGESVEDKKNLVDKLNGIKQRTLSGESFEKLAKELSEDEATRGTGGYMGKFTVDGITPDIRRDLATIKEGEISEPAQINISATESAYRILKFEKKIPAHKIDFKEDRNQIAKMATAYKQNKEYSKWLAELRNKIYWEIK